MTQTIHKEQFRIEDVERELTVALPGGSIVLSVAEQYPGILAFWYRCDPYLRTEDRHFVVVGTGHEVDPALVYHGTAICDRGRLVLHLMERVCPAVEVAA